MRVFVNPRQPLTPFETFSRATTPTASISLAPSSLFTGRVAETECGVYRIGSWRLEFGTLCLHQLVQIVQILQQVASQIVQEIGEDAQLARLEHTEVASIAKAISKLIHTARFIDLQGTSGPTAVARELLSKIPEAEGLYSRGSPPAFAPCTTTTRYKLFKELLPMVARCNAATQPEDTRRLCRIGFTTHGSSGRAVATLICLATEEPEPARRKKALRSRYVVQGESLFHRGKSNSGKQTLNLMCAGGGNI
jgi:DNA-binding IclR family transcriptional regulator